MTRYAVALLLVAIAFGPLVVGARRIRRRFLGELTNSESAIAVAVMCMSAIVVAAELLGTLGLFRRVAMCVVLAAIGLVGCAIGSSTPKGVAPSCKQGGGLATKLVTVGVVAVVVASWTARVAASFRNGMETVDTLWYHMPAAARFVQTGSTTSLHYVNADPVTVFYPATSPLLHAFSMQLFANDFASPFMNLGWLALTLLASWSIGAAYGVGPVTLTGGAIVVSTPGFVATQPGGAYTDIVGLSLFLSAVALLLRAQRVRDAEPVVMIVSGLAAGLALGAKFTFLAPVGALALGVLCLVLLGAPGARLRAAVAWCVPCLLVGSYFYVRNAVRVGNPLPQLSFGPLNLPTPPVRQPTFTVAQYVLDASVWRRFYVPGLWDALGPAWWCIIGVAIVASALAVVKGGALVHRLLGAVIMISIVAYLLTPQFLGFVDRPVYFVFNVRYVSTALALGLCLLPILPMIVRVAQWVFVVYVAVFAATQYGPTIWSWSSVVSRARFVERVATADVAIGIAVGLLTLILGVACVIRPDWRPPVTAALLFCVALLALGYPLQQSYLRHRYVATFPLFEIFDWARRQHDQRIGVVGVVTQYPLYGVDDSNFVQYLGKHGDDGAFAPLVSCADWRRTINAGRYDYLVIVPESFGLNPNASPAPELAWTRSDEHARVVLEEGGPRAPAVVVELSGPLDPDACPA
jgi:hypothetical protein